MGVAGVTRLADYSTTAPGQSTAFSYFSSIVLSGSNAAFYGNYNSGNGAGVYTGTVGTAGATRLADTSTTAPGQSTAFSYFNNPVLSGSNVAFSASYNSNPSTGIYTGTVGTAGLTRLADTSTTVPGQSTTFSGFGNPILSGANIVFSARYASNQSTGIFTGTVGTAGLTRLADTSTTAPGQSTVFTSFFTLILSGSNIAFVASFDSANYRGIYTGTVGVAGITRVADYTTYAPARGVFRSFGIPRISGSNVAFTAASYSEGYGGSLDNGIYLYLNGTLTTVAVVGDPLFGNMISALNLTGLDGYNLTYTYTLASGVSGVATFTIPVTAPTLTITRGTGGVYNFAFQTQTAQSYQLQRSTDLRAWTNVGAAVSGDGTVKTPSDTGSGAKTFWRVVVQRVSN